MSAAAVDKEQLLKKQKLPWVQKPQMVGLGMMSTTILYYTITHFFPFHRAILATPTMRIATGVFLMLWMAMLWNMFSAREGGDREDARFWNRRRHELLGATVPLPYFLHAETPGYGLLFLLSGTLALTLLTGIFSPRTLRNLFPNQELLKQPAVRALWLVGHVLLSTLLLGLIAVHVYTAMWYH